MSVRPTKNCVAATRIMQRSIVLELVRCFSELHILASQVSREELRDIAEEDPSDFAFTVLQAIKELRKRNGTLPARFAALDNEIDELLTYLRKIPPRQNEGLVAMLSGKGFTAVEIFDLLPVLTRRKPHRPVSTRLGAVKAAELYDAGNSWTKIANKLPKNASPDETHGTRSGSARRSDP
jgi:hypothetical protein